MNDELNIPENASLEQAFACLDEAVARLQNPDLPLEEAFAAYQKGQQLLAFCEKKLDLVDKQVKEISGE